MFRDVKPFAAGIVILGVLGASFPALSRPCEPRKEHCARMAAPPCCCKAGPMLREAPCDCYHQGTRAPQPQELAPASGPIHFREELAIVGATPALPPSPPAHLCPARGPSPPGPLVRDTLTSRLLC